MKQLDDLLNSLLGGLIFFTIIVLMAAWVWMAGTMIYQSIK